MPLGALRARGLALEIGPDELRMDETEARQLLSAAGLDLADAEVAELTEHTEGWSAGLYLAALSAKRERRRVRARPRSAGTTVSWPTICARSSSRGCRPTSSAS